MQTIDFPKRILTDSEKRTIFNIVVKGNRLLRKWSPLVYRKQNQGRRFRNELNKGVIGQGLDRVPRIPAAEIAAMKRVAEVEGALIEGYFPMVANLANRIYRWAENSGHLKSARYDLDDMIQDGLLALRDAIYGYANPEVKFITYATTTVQRRIWYKVVMSKDMSGFTERDFQLMGRYYKALAARQDKVINITELGFTPEEVVRIGQILRANFAHPETEESSPIEPSERENNLESLITDQALERANLTERERMSLLASVYGELGDLSRLAEQWGVSRMMVSKYRQKAEKKVRQSFIREGLAPEEAA